jgi:hypothetical protein
MFSFVTLPEGAVTDITASIGTMVTDLWLVIALVVGLPLAFYVIRRIIGLFPKAK